MTAMVGERVERAEVFAGEKPALAPRVLALVGGGGETARVVGASDNRPETGARLRWETQVRQDGGMLRRLARRPHSSNSTVSSHE